MKRRTFLRNYSFLGIVPFINKVTFLGNNCFGMGLKNESSGKKMDPICKVKKELYLKYPEPGIAPIVHMAYIGNGIIREEVRGYEQHSDWHEDRQRRISHDNGKSWSEWEPLENRTQYSGETLLTEERWYLNFQNCTRPPFDPVSRNLIRPAFQRITMGDPASAIGTGWNDKSGRLYRDHGFYELSEDNGITWREGGQLMYEEGACFNPDNWANPDFLHTNEMYIGNAIVLKSGSVAICATVPVPYAIPEDEKYGNESYKQGYVGGAICFVGKWDKRKKNYRWQKSNSIFLPRRISSRGLGELCISELKNGNLLMIMRGSNAGLDIDESPGRKWHSVSKDGGLTWETVKDLRYDTGETFYSSASYHKTIRSSKTGKLYWIGNINLTPARGSYPRYPLQIVEIDEEKAALKKDTVTVIDTRAEDEPEGVQLSNFSILEDTETKNIEIYLTRYGENENKGLDVNSANAYKYTLYM